MVAINSEEKKVLFIEKVSEGKTDNKGNFVNMKSKETEFNF